MPETTNQPKFPNVVVKLTSEDGNSFSILGRVERALRQAGVSKEDRTAYMDEATSGDYDHLLQITMAWVTVT